MTNNLFKVVTTLLLLSALTSCGNKPSLKLVPPPSLCIRFNTSEVLVSYAPAVTKEELVQSVVKRINRYLNSRLQERSIRTTEGSCSKGDAVLDVRLDSLEEVAKTKHSISAPTTFIRTTNARIKYVATLRAPDGALLDDYEDDRNNESLDDLASVVASKLTKLVAPYY